MADVKLSPAQAQDILRRHLEGPARSTGPAAWQVRTQAYQAGEIIIPRQARTSALGLVVRGFVAVYTTPRATGRPYVVLTPGHTFGQAVPAPGQPAAGSTALQATQPACTTLKALTSCEIWYATRSREPDEVAGRRASRPGAPTWYRLGHAALLLAIVLVAVLVMCLPAGRPAIALLPMGLARWCSRQGDDLCAEQAWQAAATLSPHDAIPLLSLGILYVDRGDLQAAEDAFEAARTREPDAPEAHNDLGFIYLKRGDYQRAASAFRLALDLEPGSSAAEQNLGLSLARLGRYAEAVGHYEAALTLGRPPAETWLNAATVYYEIGKLTQAAEAARQALYRDGALAPAYKLLGIVALQLQQPKEALAVLRRAVDLDPGDAQAHLYLGLALEALEQPAAGLAAFQQALAGTADEDTRRQILRHLDMLDEPGTTIPN